MSQNKAADKRRDATYIEMIDLLDKAGKCAVVRPTGFGKTGLLTRLLKSGIYKRPLYVYPAEVIKNTVFKFFLNKDSIDPDDVIQNVDFMTNAKFARLTEDKILDIGHTYDLIIFDECHKMGGKKTAENLDKLIDEFPALRVVGATATPDRTDAIDVIGRYFGESTVSEYTIHNAFQDGILQKPYYVYCSFARPEENETIITEEWKKEVDLIDDVKERMTLTEELSIKTKEISNLYNMDRIIKRTCDKYTDTEYMKFIVFFPTFKGLDDKSKKVRKWFKKAYPNHKIRELVITSETPEVAENVNDLDALTYEKNIIDLIYVIDMLNMGYHVNNLTGIIMYRGTISSIIYGQELGRALSTGTDKTAIVFDVVDNLHNRAIYEMIGKESLYTKNAKERMAILEKKAEKWDAFVRKCEISTSPENLRRTIAKKEQIQNDLDEMIKAKASPLIIKKLKARLSEVTVAAQAAQEELDNIKEKIKENFGRKNLEKIEFTSKDQSELNSLHRRFENDYQPCCNTISKEDLIVIDEEAEYRELIRKLIAEPKAARINRVWENYLENGGKYRDENGSLFTRKEQFLALKAPKEMPLEIFCPLRRVTVDEVLDWVLGESNNPEFAANAQKIFATSTNAQRKTI